ncbi:MAG TPA: copper amine oxidase N-terminal domain-containing protein, partial [Syntrophomonadaceae bacterium]|nr:copper amine oxidase N-terminal domain-containing protein [Syntrophomonadaceae bacterium]
MKKRWLILIAVVVLICGLAAATWADQPIKLVVNGQEIKSDVPPQIIGDRTMVPVRWIAEALGAEVEWDAASRTVIITTKGNTPDNEQAVVSKLVADFGQRLKNVSLLAPDDVVTKSIKENYAEYVSPELLAQWQKDPANAPGRLTSSPWPERIDI